MAVCTISGTISLLDGTPAANQQVLATVDSTQADQSGQFADTIGVVSTAIEAFTDDAGAFTIDLLQGAMVLVEVPGINLRKKIMVPAAADAVLADLI